MKAVRLINLDHDAVQALLTDLKGFEQRHHVIFNGTEKTVKLISLSTKETLDSRKIDPQWWVYLGVDDGTGEVVGTCAFQGEPQQGVVEIEYLTFPQFLGEGYAVAMADALVRIAKGSSQVRRVVAHTLPQPNASSWILERIGMRFVGKEPDPSDGWVWRWELDLAVPPARAELVSQSATDV